MSPSSSEAQRRAACAALAAKNDKKYLAKLKGAALDMYKSMSVAELKEFCGSVKE